MAEDAPFGGKSTYSVKIRIQNPQLVRQTGTTLNICNVRSSVQRRKGNSEIGANERGIVTWRRPRCGQNSASVKEWMGVNTFAAMARVRFSVKTTRVLILEPHRHHHSGGAAGHHDFLARGAFGIRKPMGASLAGGPFATQSHSHSRSKR